MRRWFGFKLLILLLTGMIPAHAFAQCDIEADSCCAVLESMGMGLRVGLSLPSDHNKVLTFTMTPTQAFYVRPARTLLNPDQQERVEATSGMGPVVNNIKKALEAKGVSPELIPKIMTVVAELTQNSADAHVRNGTLASGRRVVVRLKVNRRQKSVQPESQLAVDQIVIEVTDNAGNATAKQGAGTWFSGKRASGEDLKKYTDLLDVQSRLMMNPVETAIAQGLTANSAWENSQKYRDIAAAADAYNAAILAKISDAEIPPDIIAEYFDAKTPDLDSLLAATKETTPADTERLKSESEAMAAFWLFTRFDIRAPKIAVKNRDGGTGGFGSVLMKAWGSQWVYAPNLDGMGNTVGTRSLFVLETPSSLLTDPHPIGFKKKEAKSVIIPGKIVADPKNVYNPDERQTRPSSLLLPSF